MSNNKREMLAHFMLCKELPPPKEHWLHIIAIEDEEQRYVTKVLGVESMFFSEECFARIARPKGYQYIWEREHGKKPFMFDTDLSEIEGLPKSQRNIEDYQDEIDFYTAFVQGTLLREDAPASEKDKEIINKMCKESEDSQQAQIDKSSAEYQLWRKQQGLSYDEGEMMRNWQSYCAYRKKYGLRPVELNPYQK